MNLLGYWVNYLRINSALVSQGHCGHQVSEGLQSYSALSLWMSVFLPKQLCKLLSHSLNSREKRRKETEGEGGREKETVTGPLSIKEYSNSTNFHKALQEAGHILAESCCTVVCGDDSNSSLLHWEAIRQCLHNLP